MHRVRPAICCWSPMTTACVKSTSRPPSRPAIRSARSEKLAPVIRQLRRRFRPKRREFDLQLAMRGTVFQLDVWRELQRIPYGETRSYEEIAHNTIGRPTATRARRRGERRESDSDHRPLPSRDRQERRADRIRRRARHEAPAARPRVGHHDDPILIAAKHESDTDRAAHASNSRTSGEAAGIDAAETTVTVEGRRVVRRIQVGARRDGGGVETGLTVDGSVSVSAIVADPPLAIVPTVQVTVVVPVHVPDSASRRRTSFPPAARR